MEKGLKTIGIFLIGLVASTMALNATVKGFKDVGKAQKPILMDDINGDGIVDKSDALLLAEAFDSKPEDWNWNPNADLNGDGVVDILDAIILGNHFLQHVALYQWLNYLVNTVNWTESMDTKYMGYIMGKTDLTDLQDGIANLTSWQDILTWSARCHKYGIDNQTKIQWALDNATMMPDGSLPQSGIFYDAPYYSVYDREFLWGYYWAIQYNYDLAKWNLTLAYKNFRLAWQYTGHGFEWYCGTADTDCGTTRYYDECGQTIACFLQFYEFNVSNGLSDAQTEWAWINNHLWINSVPQHYTYAYTWIHEYSLDLWECEAGGFLEIIDWLKYHNSSLLYTDRLVTDFQNRFLSNGWQSPQWTINASVPNYSVIHAYCQNNNNSCNSQTRLENTVMAWAPILGLFDLYSTSARQNVTNLLQGYNGFSPAWYLLLNPACNLYDPTTSQFRMRSDEGTSNVATALAVALVFHDGIVPISTTLAVPIEEMHYEYIYNMLDHDLVSTNLNERTVTLGIACPGTMAFIYNKTVHYDFAQTGMYDVTFNSNWSSITNCIRIGDLPTNRNYLFQVFAHGSDAG